MVEETKICSSCKEEKEFSEFHRHKRMKDGRCSICIICRGIKRRKEQQIKICVECSTGFKTVKPNQFCCSEECRKKNHYTRNKDIINYQRRERRRKATIHYKKECPICKTSFSTKFTVKIFCSKKCATKDWWNNLSVGENTKKSKEYATSNWNKNKIKILSRNRIYAKNNRGKCNQRAKKLYWKDVKISRIKSNEKQKKYINDMTDFYVANQITRRTNLIRSDIPQSLIDTKREHIKLRRLINELS